MTYRPMTRTIPREEYYGLMGMITNRDSMTRKGQYLTNMRMLDDDMQPTQKMAEVRWILADSYMNNCLFQVDNAGNAILLIRGE